MAQSKPNLDQRRAAHAWKAVAAVKALPEDQKKSYGTEAKKLQVRILTAGLAASLAFLRARARDRPSNTTLGDDLSDWAIRERKLASGEKDLLDSIVKGNSLFLRRATEEMLAYLQWLVRFAEGEGLTEDDGA
jgi:CRISPR-associated protein Cmr5